jgi:hypothetical protein
MASRPDTALGAGFDGRKKKDPLWHLRHARPQLQTAQGPVQKSGQKAQHGTKQPWRKAPQGSCLKGGDTGEVRNGPQSEKRR